MNALNLQRVTLFRMERTLQKNSTELEEEKGKNWETGKKKSMWKKRKAKKAGQRGRGKKIKKNKHGRKKEGIKTI